MVLRLRKSPFFSRFCSLLVVFVLVCSVGSSVVVTVHGLGVGEVIFEHFNNGYIPFVEDVLITGFDSVYKSHWWADSASYVSTPYGVSWKSYEEYEGAYNQSMDFQYRYYGAPTGIWTFSVNWKISGDDAPNCSWIVFHIVEVTDTMYDFDGEIGYDVNNMKWMASVGAPAGGNWVDIPNGDVEATYGSWHNFQMTVDTVNDVYVSAYVDGAALDIAGWETANSVLNYPCSWGKSMCLVAVSMELNDDCEEFVSLDDFRIYYGGGESDVSDMDVLISKFMDIAVVGTVLLVPVFLFTFYLKMGVWGFVGGITIGAVLGIVFLPTYFPVWALFAVFLVDAGVFVSTWKGG